MCRNAGNMSQLAKHGKKWTKQRGRGLQTVYTAIIIRAWWSTDLSSQKAGAVEMNPSSSALPFITPVLSPVYVLTQAEDSFKTSRASCVYNSDFLGF